MSTRSFRWAGERWTLSGDVLTGEWYRYIRSVHVPLSEASGADYADVEPSMKASAAFASGYLEHIKTREPLSPEAIIQFASERKARIWPDLCGAIIAASGWGKFLDEQEYSVGDRQRSANPILAYYRVVFDAEEYVDTDGGVCGCGECSELIPAGDIDPTCKFRRPHHSRAGNLIGSISPELVNIYWDRPLYLYQHAKQQKRAQSEGYGIERQKREANRERAEADQWLDDNLSHIPRA